jgi:hypothetical protein
VFPWVLLVSLKDVVRLIVCTHSLLVTARERTLVIKVWYDLNHTSSLIQHTFSKGSPYRRQEL